MVVVIKKRAEISLEDALAEFDEVIKTADQKKGENFFLTTCGK